MNRTNTTTIRRLGSGIRMWLGLTLLALAAALMAHGGFDHVIGVVVKVERDVLTVKTAKGNVEVRINTKTEITRNDQQLSLAGVKPGSRVVVDIPEGSKDKVAHSVKVGVSSASHPETHR